MERFDSTNAISDENFSLAADLIFLHMATQIIFPETTLLSGFRNALH
jgi:hypothetical protein